MKTIAALLALSLIVAACGSDDSADDSAVETTAAPAETTTTAPAEEMTDEEMAEPGTIVDVATEAGAFSTLLTAATEAGLVDTLTSEGPFTVFAPTDEAFAALPEGALEDLLADPEALADVLLYHVVAGEVLAADVVGLESATAAQDGVIAIEVVDGQVLLNGTATVVTTDIDASNGVIHVIDAVILPPNA
jgi:uncharacterized surface protein with fasciclin (FAS1) repeats